MLITNTEVRKKETSRIEPYEMVVIGISGLFTLLVLTLVLMINLKGGIKKTLHNLVPWYTRKEEPFSALQKELERLFDLAPFERFEKSFVPKIDVKETKKDIQVAAELPGMDEKDIDVTLHEGSLIIKGEKKNEHEDKKDGYHRMERSYGSFYRAIALPEGIDEEKVEANYKKGVLKIVIPKTKKAQEKQKKIEVKTV